jgi:heme-degrading monooxygenase HmoA
MTFVYVWEYRVLPAHAREFEAAYGPEGAWARLFRRQEGYLGTDLLRDRADPQRYLTVDRWRAKGDHEAFRRGAAAEFAALDRAGEAWTSEERHLGDFECVRK